MKQKAKKNDNFIGKKSILQRLLKFLSPSYTQLSSIKINPSVGGFNPIWKIGKKKNVTITFTSNFVYVLYIHYI